jgi:riboflavin kinase/FMN adenylyltransferase
MVLTFSNQPRTLVGQPPVPVITSLDQRVSLIEETGIDCVVVLEFTSETASMEPRYFLERVILDGLGCGRIVAGFDWRFGEGRRGGRELLLELKEEGVLSVRFTEAVGWQGEIVSSTAIRSAVQAGDLDRAAGMLGRPFSVRGKVVRGSGRGRSLGFPTANLDLEGRLRPPDGVYAAAARIGGKDFVSVASLGAGPTFGGDPEAVEAHLVEFSGDLYGETIELEFRRFLRGQEKFAGEEDLTVQIRNDIEETTRLADSAEGRVS